VSVTAIAEQTRMALGPPIHEGGEPWDRRRDGRAAAVLFVLALTVYLLTASYTINQMNDTRDTAVSAWSLATRGTLALPEEWPEDVVFWATPGSDGRQYTDRFPGPILWTTPFYAVTELVSPRGTPPHPYLMNYAPAGVAAALAAALAVTVAFAVYRRLERRRFAWLAAAFLALGTGMWSVAADSMWTHGVGSLFLLLAVLATSSRRYGWAGAAFALAILCRPQLAVIAAVIGLWEGARHRDLRPVLQIGLVSATGVVAMGLYSRVIFGTWLPVAGYSTDKVSSVVRIDGSTFLENVGMALIHPWRGLLLYTPILLLLLPGLWRGWRVAPSWVRSSAVAGVVYAVVQLRANGWDGGADYFGSRLLLESLVLATPLLLLVFREFVLPGARAFQLTVGVVLLGSVVLHGLGATVLETGFGGIDGVTVWQETLEELCANEPEMCAWR
jgi:hypothetical protein